MAKKNGNGKTKKTNESTALQQHQKPGEVADRLVATPFTFMRRFSEEMDHLFEDFGLGRGLLTPMLDKANLPQSAWYPQVEMFERGNQLVLRADLPGLTKDDVNVELSDHAITISGERKTDHEEKGEGFYRTERNYGKFFRHIPMPEGANAEDAKAKFNDGVLEVIVPTQKREPRKTRRLAIGSDARSRA